MNLSIPKKKTIGFRLLSGIAVFSCLAHAGSLRSADTGGTTPNPGREGQKMAMDERTECAAPDDIRIFSGTPTPTGARNSQFYRITDIKMLQGALPDDVVITTRAPIGVANHITDSLTFGKIMPFTRYLFVLKGKPDASTAFFGPHRIISVSPLEPELGVDRIELAKARWRNEPFSWRDEDGNHSLDTLKKKSLLVKRALNEKKSLFELLVLLGPPSDAEITKDDLTAMRLFYDFRRELGKDLYGKEKEVIGYSHPRIVIDWKDGGDINVTLTTKEVRKSL